DREQRQQGEITGQREQRAGPAHRRAHQHKAMLIGISVGKTIYIGQCRTPTQRSAARAAASAAACAGLGRWRTSGSAMRTAVLMVSPAAAAATPANMRCSAGILP